MQIEKFEQQTQPLFVIIDKNGEQILSEAIGYGKAKNGGLLPFLESIE